MKNLGPLACIKVKFRKNITYEFEEDLGEKKKKKKRNLTWKKGGDWDQSEDVIWISRRGGLVKSNW